MSKLIIDAPINCPGCHNDLTNAININSKHNRHCNSCKFYCWGYPYLVGIAVKIYNTQYISFNTIHKRCVSHIIPNDTSYNVWGTLTTSADGKRLTYFEPNFEDYDNLINKIKTYLTFS
jgi:hypothetical protein